MVATTLGGTAAGVPFVALPPAGGSRSDAPVVLAWHLLGAPHSEVAFASAHLSVEWFRRFLSEAPR